MFIKFGNKRINMSLVKEYKVYDKSLEVGYQYQIELTFLSGDKDYLHFFERKEGRDKYIKFLDENLLVSGS
jgi:hypothetical protein